MSSSIPYRGRFAPSPTGPLHFGSLIAATGSYLQAKNQQGEWLLRIDDIDPPREQKGAADEILKTLEGFGFEWDSEILYQSSRLQRYQEAVDELIQRRLAYACSCSRKELLRNAEQTKAGTVYPGFCRNKSLIITSKTSTRLRCDNEPVRFEDLIQGSQCFDMGNQIGDFILQRRDRLFSYHLASGIDDAEQKITEVIRGSDLLNSTPCHIHVQQVLNLASPQYSHLPIVVDKAGHKLSKQSFATPINTNDAVVLLYKTLKFLGQMPPIYLLESNLEDIWCWAKNNWQLNLVPNKIQITIN